MQGSQPVSRYLVVREDTERPILVAAGRFEHDDLETLVEHARQQLSEQGLKVAQAILLLPRGDVEVNSLELPPATEDELPELVANLLAQQADDSTELFANDFLVTNEKDTNNAQKTEGTGGVPEPAATDDDFTDAASHEVVTFSVPQATVDSWSQRFKEQGFRLQAVTFGGLGAVHLLGQVSTKPARTSIVVTTTDQDTDLAVVENGLPILFRTIPRATGGEQFVTEQLAGEIQRTLALVGHPDDEQTRVYLIGTMDEQEDTATLLSDKLSLAVTLVNPFDQLRGNQKVDRPSRFANLIGTACAANQNNLSVDLLNPRQPKAQPSVWHRYGFWAIVASLLLAVCGYLLLEQGADQRAEIEAKQVQFNRLVKRAKKAQSKVKITSAIDNWRDSEICWLDELNFLSSKLPPPDEVTINSLTMAAGSVPKQRGRMDMSVEVSDPSVRLAMEHAIRDDRHTPTSKRVTDASNRSGSAWRFQTIVTVAPQRVKLTSAATAPASAKNKTKSEPAKSEPAKSKPGTSDSDLRSSVSTPTEAAEGEVNHGE